MASSIAIEGERRRKVERQRAGRALSNLRALEYLTLARPLPEELPEKPVSLAEVAEIFDLPDLSESRIRRWIRQGYISGKQGIVRDRDGKLRIDLRKMAECLPKEGRIIYESCGHTGMTSLFLDEIETWSREHSASVTIRGWKKTRDVEFLCEG
jgi:hypothetical protein